MAEKNHRTEEREETVLVAHVTVHLESGESFELLPFEDVDDVKARVCDLMRAWATSGFLIRGSHIYPWHRVKRIEATKVEELSKADSALYMEEFRCRDTDQMMQSFWKTKHERKQKDEGEEGRKDDPPRMAA